MTFSEAGGSSHGTVFNNTNDSYGQDLGAVLLPAHITACQAAQATRTDPRNCADYWTQFLGQPLSTINRDGNANFDRPIIAKTSGWKTFPITARQSFTLGGHATWQSGANWDRTETVDSHQSDRGAGRARHRGAVRARGVGGHHLALVAQLERGLLVPDLEEPGR